jgi:hypothetical protein
VEGFGVLSANGFDERLAFSIERAQIEKLLHVVRAEGRQPRVS